MLPPEEHYRRLERMYLSAPINAWHRPAIRVAEGMSEVVVTVRNDFFHAAHAMHGALYFKSLDDSSFFAANSVVFDVFVLTVTFNVVLLRPVTEGVITARTLARGSGTFMLSKTALGPEVEYR